MVKHYLKNYLGFFLGLNLVAAAGWASDRQILILKTHLNPSEFASGLYTAPWSSSEIEDCECAAYYLSKINQPGLSIKAECPLDESNPKMSVQVRMSEGLLAKVKNAGRLLTDHQIVFRTDVPTVGIAALVSQKSFEKAFTRLFVNPDKLQIIRGRITGSERPIFWVKDRTLVDTFRLELRDVNR